MGGVNLSEILPGEHCKNVTVDWSYPKLLDNFWFDEQSGSYGLYYISRKFGQKETLLYIGQTYDNYYNRLVDHEYNWLGNYRGKKFIRCGSIVYPVNKADEELRQLIKDVEGMLIFEMRFSLQQNSMGIYSYTPKHLYKITNTGYKGELSPTVSMKNHKEGYND